MAENRHVGTERDNRKREEGRDSRNDGREDEDRPVRENRDDVLFEHQLHAVGQALQPALGAVPVRADPLLHPSDHLTLEHDGEKRCQQQEREHGNGLEEDQPERVAAEGRQVRISGGSGQRLPHGHPERG